MIWWLFSISINKCYQATLYILITKVLTLVLVNSGLNYKSLNNSTNKTCIFFSFNCKRLVKGTSLFWLFFIEIISVLVLCTFMFRVILSHSILHTLFSGQFWAFCTSLCKINFHRHTVCRVCYGYFIKLSIQSSLLYCSTSWPTKVVKTFTEIYHV